MRIARKIYTRSFSGATSFSRYLSRHDRYDIFALFPTVLSILQQRRTTSLSIRTNRPARPFSTREVFSFEDQGIPTLFHFSSISSFLALVTLFPLLAFACHVPREPDVALTLANQLDFATRMRDQHD